MSKTREKFRELLNDIAERDGVRRFNKLAELTGIAPNTFTRIKKNEGAEVDIETFRKLNAAFGNRYNIQWFQGDSEYMLLSDVPEKEKGNPDFSSYINAILAKSDETIASLKRELDAKDEVINAKNDQISILQSSLSDKDDYIATLKSRITELMNIINANSSGIPDYITPGVAEKNQKRARK
jgi:transcriptional regulator with XRE-family HTH domain